MTHNPATNDDARKSKYEEKLRLKDKRAATLGFVVLLLGFLVETVTIIVAGGLAVWRGQENSLSWVDIAPPIIWLILAAIAYLWMRRFVDPALKELERTTGTYYFIRAQPTGRLSWHFQDVSKDFQDVDDFKAIQRSVQDVTPGEIVFDLSEDGGAISAELERLTNLDDDHSLFQIAPELMWPMAFRLGHDWFPRGDVEMVEIQQAQQSITWRFTDEVGSGGLTSVQRVLKDSPSDVPRDVFYPYGVDIYPYAPSESRAFPVLSTFTEPQNDDAHKHIKHVKLELLFTHSDIKFHSTAKLAVEDTTAQYDVVRTCVPFNPDLWDKEASPNNPSTAYGVCIMGQPGAQAPENGIVIGGKELSQMVAELIALTLRDFPNAVIDVVARIPKSIAFAAGMNMLHLRKDPSRVNVGPTDYWTRLRLMHYDAASRATHWLISHPVEKRYQATIEAQLQQSSTGELEETKDD